MKHYSYIYRIYRLTLRLLHFWGIWRLYRYTKKWGNIKQQTFHQWTGGGPFLYISMVGGLEHFYFSISYIGISIHPNCYSLTPSFFRGVGQPPNSVYINLICSLWKFPPLSSMLLAINLHGQFGDFSKRGPRLMTPEGINPYSIKLSYGNIPLLSI